ncbi:glycine zipper 2TM domain-containing protein [Pseudorhodoferax sp.]|uniref:glycine zipper 2TM domain-containing protein n=1 Tax=Pseudorhodoferax sp. TaxID=1993553 RepID=UPI002DD695F6|nr:glycine zipper 2TM domain-containing protein [Pseudorhodoferax sp.]
MQEQPTNLFSSSNRPLWLAVGVLAVAVAGLGGTLLGTQLSGGAPAQPTAGMAAGLVPFEEQAPAPAVKPAPVRATPVTPREPAVQQAAVASCESCGTVVSVTAVQRAGQASGVGAVAGGVVGGVLGNQIGGGSGRAVATVLGAVGGGWAGHETEKRVRQTTRYAVRVRMDDGTVRTVEQAQAPAVGSPVLVQGGVAQLRTGAVAVRG